MVPPELEEGLVVAPENEKAAADAEEAAEAMQRGADRLVETAKRLTLLLFFISSMGWSLAEVPLPLQLAPPVVQRTVDGRQVLRLHHLPPPVAPPLADRDLSGLVSEHQVLWVRM